MNSKFKWEDLGNLQKGRPTLGPSTDVLMYRLMQYTLRDAINMDLGGDKGGEFLYKAGEIAGRAVFQNLLSDVKDLNELVVKLADLLSNLKAAILRMEESDPERGFFVFTAAEDLDCSGVPNVGKTICQFDEGIIAGILGVFLNKRVTVKEVDCWANGATICRLEAKVEQ